MLAQEVPRRAAVADGAPCILVHAGLGPPVDRIGHVAAALDKSLEHALFLRHDTSDISASIDSSETPLPVAAVAASPALGEAAPSVSPVPRVDVHAWPGITAGSPSQINASEVPHKASEVTRAVDYISCIH